MTTLMCSRNSTSVQFIINYVLTLDGKLSCSALTNTFIQVLNIHVTHERKKCILLYHLYCTLTRNHTNFTQERNSTVA